MSGMSVEAQGMIEADIAGKPAELAMPTKLVNLAADSAYATD